MGCAVLREEKAHCGHSHRNSLQGAGSEAHGGSVWATATFSSGIRYTIIKGNVGKKDRTVEHWDPKKKTGQHREWGLWVWATPISHIPSQNSRQKASRYSPVVGVGAL